MCRISLSCHQSLLCTDTGLPQGLRHTVIPPLSLRAREMRSRASVTTRAANEQCGTGATLLFAPPADARLALTTSHMVGSRVAHHFISVNHRLRLSGVDCTGRITPLIMIQHHRAMRSDAFPPPDASQTHVAPMSHGGSNQFSSAPVPRTPLPSPALSPLIMTPRIPTPGARAWRRGRLGVAVSRRRCLSAGPEPLTSSDQL